MRSTKRRELVWLVGLLLLAAALRIIGLDFGQPDMGRFPTDATQNYLPLETPIHPDEYFYVAIPVQMLTQRRLNPEFYENPSFLINLDTVTYLLTGWPQRTPEDLHGVNQRQFAPFPLYVIGRVYSMLGGMLAVAGATATGRLLAGSRAGFAAGIIVAVALPMVQHAHYATTSSLAAGFVSVAIWASLIVIKCPHKKRWLLLAGVAAGLAAGNRYNAAAVVLVVAFSGVLLLWRRRAWGTVIAAALFIPLTFVLTTPGAVFKTRDFLEQFRYIAGEFTGGGEVSRLTALGLWYEWRYLILFGIGLPALFFAGAGVVWALRVRRTFPWIAWSVAALLILLTAYSVVVLRTIRGHGDQLLVPILPSIAILAGLGIEWASRRWTWRAGTARAVALLVGVWPLALSLTFVYWISLPDTRTQVQDWIYANLLPGTTFHLAGAYNVSLDLAMYPHQQTFGSENQPTLDQLRSEGVDYIIWSDAIPNDQRRSAEVVSQEVLDRDTTALAELQTLPVVFEAPRPDWIGQNMRVHTATVWHQPGITVYCLLACEQ